MRGLRRGESKPTLDTDGDDVADSFPVLLGVSFCCCDPRDTHASIARAEMFELAFESEAATSD